MSIERKTPKGVFLFHIVSIYYKKHIMKIIKLTESDLQKIVKRVINEQVLSDYNQIVEFIKKQGGKEITSNTGDITRYKFDNYGGGKIGYVEITKIGTPKITVYTMDSKGNKSDVMNIKNIEDLKNIMSPYN